MPTDPTLGPFGQYLTQSLEPTPIPKPSGLGGFGESAAYLAGNFINGMRQAKSQRFAMEQMKQAREEQAYQTAMQHVAASGLPDDEKNHLITQLSIPLIQRIAADKDATTKNTGNHLTDFVKGIATNLVGGNLPKKQEPLDMAPVTAALLHAADPANSAVNRANLVDQQASKLTNDIVNGAKNTGKNLTSLDFLGHEGLNNLAAEHQRLVGKPLPALTRILSEVQAPPAIKDVSAQITADQAAYRQANNFPFGYTIPKDINDRILEKNGVIAGIKNDYTEKVEQGQKAWNLAHSRAPETKIPDEELPGFLRGIGLQKDEAVGFSTITPGRATAVALGSNYPNIKTDKGGNPVNASDLYLPETNHKGDVVGLVPVDRNRYDRFVDMAGGPHYALRDRFDPNAPIIHTKEIPPLQTGTTVLSGEDPNNPGVNKNVTQRIYGGINTPPQSTAPPPVSATPGSNFSADNPFAPSTSKPPTAATTTPPNAVVGPKGHPLNQTAQDHITNIQGSLYLVGKLEGLLNKTGKDNKPLKDDNSLTSAVGARWDNFLYNHGISPGEWNEAIQQLSSLTSVEGAAPYTTGGSRSQQNLNQIREHLPKPTDTPHIMSQKIAWMKDFLPELKTDIERNASRRVYPNGITGTTPPPVAQPKPVLNWK